MICRFLEILVFLEVVFYAAPCIQITNFVPVCFVAFLLYLLPLANKDIQLHREP